VHEDDAAAAGIADGDRARLTLSSGTAEILLHTSASMARGIVIVPRHRRIPWQLILNTLGGVRLDPLELTGARQA
jgi:NADH-quinone oxidoreductase subunit G